MIYDYIMFDEEKVADSFCYRSSLFLDSYISEDSDGEMLAIKDALNKGYRWVRTENSKAIFEKCISCQAIVTSSNDYD